jgi:hypothetical protein
MNPFRWDRRSSVVVPDGTRDSASAPSSELLGVANNLRMMPIHREQWVTFTDPSFSDETLMLLPAVGLLVSGAQCGGGRRHERDRLRLGQRDPAGNELSP